MKTIYRTLFTYFIRWPELLSDGLSKRPGIHLAHCFAILILFTENWDAVLLTYFALILVYLWGRPKEKNDYDL